MGDVAADEAVAALGQYAAGWEEEVYQIWGMAQHWCEAWSHLQPVSHDDADHQTGTHLS